jgi:hypothetical protein
MIDGIEVSDVVPLDGGEETFVYTGREPTAIRITEVVDAIPPLYRSPGPASVTGPVAPRVPLASERDSYGPIPLALATQAAATRQTSPSSPISSSPLSPPSDDSSFAGYPSAY